MNILRCLQLQNREPAGVVNRQQIDPSTLANGVYQLRLIARNLIGGSSEIDSRIEINSTTKSLTQATAASPRRASARPAPAPSIASAAWSALARLIWHGHRSKNDLLK